MSKQENLEFVTEDDSAYNFRIVHLYNRSDTYHLTRQILLDSSLTQDTYSFFYHILAKSTKEFNEKYGSFAFIIARNQFEADLYLNVDPTALEHIVKYIQTGKINGPAIYSQDWKIVDEIIDLAIMFGIPNLVTIMRELQPTEEMINRKITQFEEYMKIGLYSTKNLVPSFEIDRAMDLLDKLFHREGRQEFIDVYIKSGLYKNNIIQEIFYNLIVLIFFCIFKEYVGFSDLENFPKIQFLLNEHKKFNTITKSDLKNDDSIIDPGMDEIDALIAECDANANPFCKPKSMHEDLKDDIIVLPEIHPMNDEFDKSNDSSYSENSNE